MRVSRRSLRKFLIGVGFLVGAPTSGGLLAAALPIAAGGALHLWSKGCLEQNRRLITSGPYRFTRNPFYLANLLIDAGLCFAIGVWWVALAYAGLWWVAYRDTIAGEEARLRSLFPEAFDRYAARVPRLFPNGRAFPANEVTGHFSFDSDGLARGQEYARLLGIAIGPVVIVAGATLRRVGLDILAPAYAGELALLVSLPALWILKLALADVFRRPEGALVPVLPTQGMRLVAIACLGGAVFACVAWRPWLGVLPALWAGLVALDVLRVLRSGSGKRVGAGRWRYLPAVTAGSLGAAAALLVVAGDLFSA